MNKRQAKKKKELKKYGSYKNKKVILSIMKSIRKNKFHSVPLIYHNTLNNNLDQLINFERLYNPDHVIILKDKVTEMSLKLPVSFNMYKSRGFNNE